MPIGIISQWGGGALNQNSSRLDEFRDLSEKQSVEEPFSKQIICELSSGICDLSFKRLARLSHHVFE
jgi:hypothetical protein